jgi:hypothetical protein
MQSFIGAGDGTNIKRRRRPFSMGNQQGLCDFSIYDGCIQVLWNIKISLECGRFRSMPVLLGSCDRSWLFDRLRWYDPGDRDRAIHFIVIVRSL